MASRASVASPGLRRGAARHARRRFRARALAIAILGLAAIGGLAAALLPRSADPAMLLVQAQAALESGDPDKATRLAEEAVSRDGRLAIGHGLLARAALARDDGVAAETALDRAARGGIDPARLHHLRADALVLQGDARGAAREAARAGFPYRLYAARIAARARALGGDPAGAQQALQAIVNAHPGDAPAWLDLGRLSLGMGQNDAAQSALGHARALRPHDPGVLALAVALRKAQRITGLPDRAVGGL